MAAEPHHYWRYDDLCSLPENKRYEIINGELFEMPSPNRSHATAVINLLARLIPIALALGGRIYTAPFDVFMPGCDPVQPDVFVLTKDQLGMASMRGVEGAPALVIEILSPGNAPHDRVLKRAMYAKGGVQEYWLVSPEAATIEVLVLEDGEFRTHVRAAEDELVTSTILPDLSFPASIIFHE